MKKKRSQASLEYTMIIAFSLLMIIPIIIIFGNEKENTKTKINVFQVDQIAQKIADTSSKVYYMGAPSQSTIKIKMPYNVENIEIINKEIIFYLKSQNNIITIIGLSDVNMTGSVSSNPGFKNILIKAKDNNVEISSN
jgi:hypothetical protein